MRENNNLYSVYEHVTPDGIFYYGVSTNVEKRWRYNGDGYRGTGLYPFIEQYGWDNIEHIVLFNNLTFEDALKIEDFLITTGWEDGVCCNLKRSGQIEKDIGEYSRNYRKEYYKKHREEILEYQKKYNYEHRENMRNRYHRKKQNKQLKELGYIPLF